MILHIDLNSYFATIEQQANPFLRGKAIGVAGKNITFQRTVVCAASIEAKRFGVKSGMNIYEARKLCPQILLVQADYDRYLECSQRFYRILEQYSPRIEIFSIDEAFIEINNKLQTTNDKETKHSKSETICDLPFVICDFQPAITAALAIKYEITCRLGSWVTASIGIAPNKFLAKLASESRKPDGLTIVVD